MAEIRDVDLYPIAFFLRIRVGISFLDDSGNADHGLLFAAMVDQGEIVFLAEAQEIAGLKVTDPVPGGFLFLFQGIERIGLRLAFK